MILKMWRLKSMAEVLKCFKYVCNPLKSEMSNADICAISHVNTPAPVTRAIKFVPEEGCMRGHFISGFLCHPDCWFQYFEFVRLQLGADLKGVLAYHIVQSFPQDLDVSNESVHSSAVELCVYLGGYPAIIATHIHPVHDEEGVEFGSCKHSHIIVFAYIHPAHRDLAHPNRLKVHDCNELREHLRVCNDCIAIDHGFPIIRTPDTDRTHSRTEHDAIEAGVSWKELVRMDIDQIKPEVSSIEELADHMRARGYEISGIWGTLTTPDRMHRVRTKKLGTEYKLSELKKFWREQEVQKADDARHTLSTALYIARLAYENPDYTVCIPLGSPHRQPRPVYQLPLCRDDIPMGSLESYFDSAAMYDIFDAHGGVVASVSGKSLLRRYEYRGREDELEHELRIAELGFPLPKRVPATPPTTEVYTDERLTSHGTHSYEVPMYDDRKKRQISLLEAIFRLAIAILLGEPQIFCTALPPDRKDYPFYASTDWKLQRLYDTMYLAAHKGIQSPAELEKHICMMESKKFRAAVIKNTYEDTKKKLHPLMTAIEVYERIREEAKTVSVMPDGPEKARREAAIRDQSEALRDSVSVLKRHGINTLHDIDQFKKTWKKLGDDLESSSSSYVDACEDLERLKSIEYWMLMAQDPRFCYGPEHCALEDLELARTSDDSMDHHTPQRSYER